jgi:hypothetical protein
MSLGRIGSRAWLIAALAALSLTVMTAGTASASNNEAAKACQKGGWEALVTQTLSGFKNSGDCTSYAAQGGVLVKPTLQVVSQVNESCGYLCLKAEVTGFGLKPGSSVVFGFTYSSGSGSDSATVNAQGEVKKGPEPFVSCPIGATLFGHGTTASGLPIKATVTGPSC